VKGKKIGHGAGIQGSRTKGRKRVRKEGGLRSKLAPKRQEEFLRKREASWGYSRLKEYGLIAGKKGINRATAKNFRKK